MKVYKYPFEIEDRFVILMPEGAKIIHVEVQHGQPCIWATVNPENTIEQRTFQVVGTGHSFSFSLSHIQTFRMGVFVWHLFEEN